MSMNSEDVPSISSPFIEGWNFMQVLGEGAYGEVKLAVCQDTNTAVAVKIIPLRDDGSCSEHVRKEMCIQKMCNHPNIVRLYGSRQNENFQFLILEYASGGELFDRIEPDVGMALTEAQRLFAQLIGAVQYMFNRGITHRDLKPENLLLDDNDNLKIADFGLATVFRHNGSERKLDKCCGTYPYVAPEVLAGKLHRAEPADVWSCGIVLVAMLAGELPWDKPNCQFAEYKYWVDNRTDFSPFSKLDVLSLSLLKKILEPNPSNRLAAHQISEHRWFKKSFAAQPVRLSSDNERHRNGKRLMSGYNLSSPEDKRSRTSRISYSQPDATSSREQFLSTDGSLDDDQLYSFSQPIDPDNMLLSQIPCTPSSSQTMMQRLVKRMTRYYVMGDRDQVTQDLSRACIQLGLNYKRNSAFTCTISTTDRRNMALVFKVTLLDIEGLMLDFRLSKGDGLEFKKYFTKLKNELDYHVVHNREPPMLSQSQHA